MKKRATTTILASDVNTRSIEEKIKAEEKMIRMFDGSAATIKHIKSVKKMPDLDY